MTETATCIHCGETFPDGEGCECAAKYEVVERIVIERYAAGGFNVVIGDRFTDQVTFDEMLGVVAALTMPPEQKARYGMLLMTKEEWQARRARWRQPVSEDAEVLP